LACALFYVFYTRMPTLRAVVILLASIVWVLLANVARVFLVGYLLKRWNINLTLGWRHDALGFALFAIALGLIWSSNRLILLLTPFLNKRVDPQEASAAADPTVDVERPNWSEAWHGSWLNSWIAGAAFGLLLTSHLVLYGITPAHASGVGEIAPSVLALNEASLPRDLDGWRREKMSEESRSVSNAFGQYSKSWAYRSPGQNAVVSLDYPFANWHELTECYYGQGWQLESSENLSAQDLIGPAHYCEHTMKKAGSRFGYLLFCQFDSTGQLLTPRDRDSVRASLQRQESAFRRLLAWNDGPDDAGKQVGSVYQFQLFVETIAPMSPSDQAKTKERFCAAYQEMRRNFANAK
jgi:exosortase/archaeosortase family protein